MPSILNATTTNGLVTSADNSGSLQLQTNNGTTAVTIDTSQNVGIGTATPATKLDVNGNIALPNATALQFKDSGGTRKDTLQLNASSNVILQSPSASIFQINGSTEAMRITAGGDLQFNSGYGSVATAYGIRAWVNFNGSNGSINGSGGVSSVTRNGTGDYTVAYSFTFPSNTYTLWGMGRRNSATQRPVLLCMNNSFYENTTTSARFFTMLNDSATVEDPIQFWFGAIR